MVSALEPGKDGIDIPEATPEPESPFLDEAHFATDYAFASVDWPEPLLELESPFAMAFEQLEPEATPEPGGGDSEDRDHSHWEPEELGSFQEEEFFSEGETGIINGDNRVRVNRTVGVPWRWICKISLKDDRGRYHSGGTGVLVSDRHVLTAAHVVYPEHIDPYRYSIEVSPALNEGDKPFGVYPISAKPRIPKNYDPKTKYHLHWDYALITCKVRVGQKEFSRLAGGPLCHWGHPRCGANTIIARMDPRALNGKAAVTAGYPERKGGKQLWCAAGILHSADARRRTMMLTADTTKGQSGSPVWVRENDRYCFVGIAAGAGQHSNTVVRVTRELIRQIQAWIREDGDTPTLGMIEKLVEETDYEQDTIDTNGDSDRGESDETFESEQGAKRPDLGVSAPQATAYDWAFRRRVGERFKALVEWAANEVDINPGLLADTLIAETRRSTYSARGEVSSFVVGTDDWFEKHGDIARTVPAHSKVRWDKNKVETDVNEKGREVKSVFFASGQDALLASAVYLKHGEEVLREAARTVGGNFDGLPVETRFALLRLAFNAGHDRAKRNLREALEGKDILIRKPRRKAGPQRMATIHAARALHLSDQIFRVPPTAGVQPELEELEHAVHHYERSFEANMDLEEYAVNELFAEVEPLSAVEGLEGYEEEAPPAGLEEGEEEIYYEEKAEYEEEEPGEEKALARMKFEFQTRNKIHRNDGKTASLLERKYGPHDFLVDKNGVRLESETNGVLEFETEWFRTWPKIKIAIEKAVKMTDDMNKAAPAKHEKTRRAFPFNVDHLRRGSKTEIAFWDKKPGMEGDKERILRAGEELEVEIIDATWEAGIQSSESFLLEYYESFLRQHEWPFYRDGTIKHAMAILDAANSGGMTATELGKLRSLLQIIVNYIMRGKGGTESEDAGAFADVRRRAPKQAFTLMSRTNFASMYKVLLTNREKRLFERIVDNDTVLKEMGLNRKSPVFINGYGTKKHEPGPTVHQWLAGIVRGVDLLSVRSGRGLSAAMGWYKVEIKRGKKDRWLVKFETRNTILGAVGIEAKDWAKYASKLFEQASKREHDALNLLHQQGIVDENKLASFLFHARHPELRGRRIRKGERALAQEWRKIREVMVRPLLQGVQHELEQFECADGE